MALKNVKRGDAVELKVPQYGVSFKGVISYERDGVTGKMVYLAAGKVSDMYFEKKDLANMRRIKVSELPKTLAEYTKNWRKNLWKRASK